MSRSSGTHLQDRNKAEYFDASLTSQGNWNNLSLPSQEMDQTPLQINTNNLWVSASLHYSVMDEILCEASWLPEASRKTSLPTHKWEKFLSKPKRRSFESRLDEASNMEMGISRMCTMLCLTYFYGIICVPSRKIL